MESSAMRLPNVGATMDNDIHTHRHKSWASQETNGRWVHGPLKQLAVVDTEAVKRNLWPHKCSQWCRQTVSHCWLYLLTTCFHTTCQYWLAQSYAQHDSDHNTFNLLSHTCTLCTIKKGAAT